MSGSICCDDRGSERFESAVEVEERSVRHAESSSKDLIVVTRSVRGSLKRRTELLSHIHNEAVEVSISQ